MYDDQRETSLAFPISKRITCTAPAVVAVHYILHPWVLADMVVLVVLVALAATVVLVVLALL
jgi:hypothetical protein